MSNILLFNWLYIHIDAIKLIASYIFAGLLQSTNLMLNLRKLQRYFANQVSPLLKLCNTISCASSLTKNPNDDWLN